MNNLFQHPLILTRLVDWKKHQIRIGTRGCGARSNEKNYYIFPKIKIVEKEAEKEKGKKYENR